MIDQNLDYIWYTDEDGDIVVLSSAYQTIKVSDIDTDNNVVVSLYDNEGLTVSSSFDSDGIVIRIEDY